ncbi:MAG: DUF192 domain-containing protein [Chloroflexi bacterium]|nr:DUF192 domain-containing protein [Chloroflexota bacterium]
MHVVRRLAVAPAMLLAGVWMAPATSATEIVPVVTAPVTIATAAGSTATIMVEVADESNVSTCGVGYRPAMPEDQGMLFIAEMDQQYAFWNRNTFIPLTLAWITSDGVVAELTDMAPVPPDQTPQMNTYYAPQVVYWYVIEANQGWYARNGVSVGDRVDLSAALALAGTQGARETLCDIYGY